MVRWTFCCAAIGTVILSAVAGTAQAQTLLAEYTFDNALNLGLDSSGLGNHATTSNVTQGLDRFGALSAGNFNGVNSTVLKAGGLTGDTPGILNFSYVAWVNRSSLDGGHSGIVTDDPPGGGCCTNRFMLDPNDRILIDAGAHSDFTFANPVINNNDWVHLAMTADDTGPGNSVNIYVDGQLAGTHSFAHNLVNTATFDRLIGIDAGGVHPLQGLLDDVQIYEGVLTAEQVNNLFQFGQLEVPEPASVALWSLVGLGALIGAVARRRRR